MCGDWGECERVQIKFVETGEQCSTGNGFLTGTGNGNGNGKKCRERE